MAQKPSIPKGTRDFPPQEMVKRNYIFETIRSVFKLYGYQPIETPAMENLNTLMGKYGEEGDRLIFKILNSGDFMKKVQQDDIEQLSSLQLSGKLCEKALRYDLTVPFARFVVQHRNEISFPFKRYQIQPVWRADRPQKGRYREFFQCDVDVVGSDSLINEVELVQIIDAVFTKLKVNTCVKINNRKILSGIADYINAPEKIVDITVAIDKLEKIGIDNVNKELSSKGISEDAIAKLQPIINLSGSSEEKFATMKEVLKESEIGLKGVEELEFVFSALGQFGLSADIELDLTLARGLNYYTGAIFEVKAKDVSIGSICGGGRYDNLTGIFGMPDVSGVGISFGADRIFDVLNQLELYPDDVQATTKILFLNFGPDEAMHCLKLCSDLRNQGISADLYADKAKIKKQMNYANSKNVPYVALIGGDEMANNTITLKNMETGEQQSLSIEDVVAKLK